MNSNEIINNGRQILNDNTFISDLITLMKTNSFRSFYNDYFTNWSDIQVMIFYMKLYSMIENEYMTQFSMNISDEIMSWSICKIMENSNLRRSAMQLFKNYKSAGLGEKIEIENDDVIEFRKLITFLPSDP